MISIRLGERLTYEFTDQDGAPLTVLDFSFGLIPPIVERVNNKDFMSKEVILTLLSDRSFAFSSLHSGHRLLWFEISEEHISAEDVIVDIKPSNKPDELYFAVLTERGKVLIFHYTLVDS